MPFQIVTENHIALFKNIVGENFLHILEEEKSKYASDHTEDFYFLPEIVLKPANENEISEILKICNQYLIPVTARGAGTGLSGGALPINGGVVLSMERFNKILEIDEDNFQVTVEPGVINQVLQNALAEKNLFYPPDPASKGSCFLGGNIAHNSGGPRALKYGVTKDYVLNLQVVLTSGEIIWTGANVLKNSTGYNLTQLMIGSEGTLGIVTKIVFKVISLPKHNVLLWVPFSDAVAACAAVAKIFQAGHTPSALEFIERKGVEISVEKQQLSFQIHPTAQAFLLIEIDGNDMELILKTAEEIAILLEENKAEDILLADTETQKELLWKIRRSIGETVKQSSVYKEEDTVVPRSKLPEVYNGVKNLEKKYGFTSVSYGHAGDGNLHINILKNNLSDEVWQNELPKAIRELFELCKKLGGTISGEHGIGYVQKSFMDIMFSETQLQLMANIKKAFDPNGILNPGKIF